MACPGKVPHYTTVQAAVNAARPGDWVLIWPGVYHEKSKRWPTAGVWIQKPGIHLRGLARNGVIIDGSNGSARRPCPSSAKLQDTNGARRAGRHRGLEEQRCHHPEPHRLRLSRGHRRPR